MMQTTFNEPMTEAQVTDALNTYAASDPTRLANFNAGAVQKATFISVGGKKVTVQADSGCLLRDQKAPPLSDSAPAWKRTPCVSD